MDTLGIKPSAKTIPHHQETHEDETSDLVALENPGCGSLILENLSEGKSYDFMRHRINRTTSFNLYFNEILNTD